MSDSNISTETIIDDLFRVKNSLERYGNEHIFSEFNITSSLYAPLMVIAEDSPNIYKVFNEAPASTSQKIQKLEKLGLVERKMNSSDKRRWDFNLSKKGASVIKAIDKKRKSGELLHIFAGMSQDDIKIFSKVLKNMQCLLNSNQTK